MKLKIGYYPNHILESEIKNFKNGIDKLRAILNEFKAQTLEAWIENDKRVLIFTIKPNKISKGYNPFIKRFYPEKDIAYFNSLSKFIISVKNGDETKCYGFISDSIENALKIMEKEAKKYRKNSKTILYVEIPHEGLEKISEWQS